MASTLQPQPTPPPSLPTFVLPTSILMVTFFPDPLVSVDSPLSRNYILQDGDIVIARTGASVGKSYRYRESDGELVFAGFLICITPDEKKLDPVFAGYYLQSKPYWDWIAAESVRSGQPGINAQQLMRLELYLPDIQYQREVGARLSDVDSLISSLERLISKKQAIKQGMIQQLLSGVTRLDGFTRSWDRTRLGTVLKFQVGYPFPSSGFSKSASGMRLVRNRDLRSNDSVIFFSGVFSEDFVLADGDILVGMDGDFEPIIWRGGPALLNQRVGRLILSRHVNGAYLSYALEKPLLEMQNSTGATTVKHLSHRDVEDLSIPLPRVEEQEAIAQILQDADQEIAALERRLESARSIKQGMMQELLTGRTRLPIEEVSS